ncbi:MAG: glutamine-hydrolyzing carbamoyl-phosphate synthase small subunit [Chloroflexi bacterium]|nr:glutamine-hydrolyzing carbamoyl-phosphate synthase small subunit [Chloroflexota bacterium]
MQTSALLALEDGTLWHGTAFGARGERTGEVVFNTSMTGYQEVLTDPSYYQQIVVMTASHIGNTGVNLDDDESNKTWLAGFAVREASRRVSNWRANESLDEYLCARNVIGISDVDTRALVRHLRTKGAMRGAVSSIDTNANRLIDLARSSPSMNGADLVRYVSCDESYPWIDPTNDVWFPLATRLDCASFAQPSLVTRHVVVYDYGIKRNTLRSLTARSCRVTVVPAQTSAQETLALKPDGVLLSNGPGDPAAVTYAIKTVRALLGRLPIMGICLGHQILGLALGGDTYKLKFGHRGGNQPVKNLLTGQVEITSHNHGFAVRADSLPRDVEVTHVNLNDQCVEGLHSRDRRAFSVQFHPEAAPGPHDAMNLFDEFVETMKGNQQ